ncbi:het domain-containing protein [Colletotrichum chrysophilum]|uniref:Het domain-containing protein n=1 Tax=Colletotrichum chrysophilum TaxID=1836956 RepID=A0AAD9E825_9PEZI|nr:het domain-containing protein [Colletotrichum chrysophilum]
MSMDREHIPERLVYQSLPHGNFIRCLVLEAGQSAEPLRCRLETWNLDNVRGPKNMFGPYYYAISYVWGTNVKSKVILCNDKTTYITPNLFEALHQIRDHVGQQIVLWADSLCINQDDEEEKSHQVALMGQIHARASRVLIHLGGGDNGHARKAGSLIRERDAYVRQNLSLLAGIRSLWYGFPRLSTEERDNITNAIPALVQSWLGHPGSSTSHEGDGGIYKERPKMRVTYLSLLWLAPLPVMLVFIATNWSRISAPEAWSIAKRLMWAVLGFLCITYPEGLVPLFLPFLLVLRAFSYALFATMSVTYADLGPGRLMKPDYWKTKEEVYTDFARQRILHGDIRIFHFAQEHSSEERGTQNALPSNKTYIDRRRV